MRITVDDYLELCKQGKIDSSKIYLDGVEVKRCLVADEEKGEVEVYISESDFCELNSLKTLDRWPTETKQGVVKVELYKNGEIVKA